MVISVSPMRCVTLPRWLTRGIFNSVGWLPFLNCASALLARRSTPAKRPRTDFDMLHITAPSSLCHLRPGECAGPAGSNTPVCDRRPLGQGVSRNPGGGTHELGNFRLKCFSSVGLVAQRLEQRTHKLHEGLVLCSARVRTHTPSDSLQETY